jgi:hypothetical protein
MYKFISIVSIALTLFVTGCATPMAVSVDRHTNAPIKIDPNKAQVYFMRDKAFVGVMRGIYVADNGKRIGGLNSGTYFLHQTAPGTHIFSVEDWLAGEDPSRTLKVSAGKKYYLKAGLQMGFWDAQPRIEIVAHEEGEAAISELAYATLNSKPQSPKTNN